MRQPPDCLHTWFEDSVRRWPDRCAVVDGDRRLTYAELDRAANRVASRLRAAGVRAEELVGVHAERCAETVIALLAVLKAGGSYLPLDPTTPIRRLRQVVADSGVRMVVGDRSGVALHQHPGVDYVEVDATDGPTGHVDRSGEHHTSAGAAYTIYTSGSTGAPKGVVVTHANVTRLFHVTETMFDFGPDDVWTLFHSVAFDFSVWEIWGALLHGGRLVVVPHEKSRSPEDFLRLLRAERVTVLNQTPSAFRQLIGAFDAAPDPSHALRLVIFGGEVLDPTLLRRWLTRHDGVRAVNMYGITETTVHVTACEITRDDTDSPLSPIGSPLPDLTVHLLDDALVPVPEGSIGEIYVGGPGVVRGYLGQPGLTASRFVPDPFGRQRARLYRSGDLARRTPTGRLIFVGRIDRQVSMRGFRIELGEIEVTARDLPGVRDAVARTWTAGDGNQRLVCYLLGTADPDQVRTALAERLPAHAVPGVCLSIDSIPMTANGKIDESALPLPAVPRTPDQQRATSAVDTLRTVFAAMLGRAEVGEQDDFFALGGDSMLAVRTVAAARDAGVPIDVPHLFRHPRPADLARAAATRHQIADGADPADGTPVLVEPDTGAEVYPASILQLGMIFHSDASGDPTVYHDLVSARVRGPFDLAALEDAIEAAVRRHEVLRTSFDFGSFDEQMQVVHHDVEVPVEVVETDGGDPDEALHSWWASQWRSAFDPETPPLLRCHVLLHAPDLVDVALSAHHSILDGWSFAVLTSEVLADYDAALVGAEPPRRQAAASYREFVARERAAIDSGDSVRFWLDHVAGASALQLPAPTADDGGPELFPQARVAVPAESMAALRRIARSMSVPVKSVALAVHCAALGEITGRDDVVSGVVVNGRPEVPGTEATLGLFLNSLPVPARVAGTPAEIVEAVAAAERAMIEHRHFPLALVQRDLGWDPVRALFNYADFHPFAQLSALNALEVTDWWFCDRTNVPVVAELSRVPMTDRWELAVRVDTEQTAAAIAADLAAAFLRQLVRFRQEIS